MESYDRGRLIFAIIFLVIFGIGMFFAYKKDLKQIKGVYKNVWVILVAIVVFYLLIFYMFAH